MPLIRSAALLALLALSTAACGPSIAHSAVDLAMTSAYRPTQATYAAPAAASAASSPGPATPGYELLAGDLHCHVLPPDSPQEVTRTVAETIDLAAEEHLDFVVLTPHVWSRFFEHPERRRAVLEGREALRATLAQRAKGNTIFILGMEYTDHRYGHVGAAFADLDQVLSEVPVSLAVQHPERFFERFVARGGLLVVNHPLVTPLDSIFAIARADLSWRPFTASGPFPAEIRAVNHLAQAFEAYNLTATHLRDRYLLDDTDHTLRATLLRLDREIVAQQRRMTPVGGSDSHTHHLRATTFVLSRSRTEAGIHEALLAGRVCVRSPEACSLEVRALGPQASPSGWVPVGGAVRGEAALAQVRGDADDIDILVDGVSVQREAGGAVRIPLSPAKCSVIRAKVGEGYSAPIYANCPFAGPS